MLHSLVSHLFCAGEPRQKGTTDNQAKEEDPAGTEAADKDDLCAVEEGNPQEEFGGDTEVESATKTSGKMKVVDGEHKE